MTLTVDGVETGINPGAFAVFFPEDAHMPLISDDLIHKVAVKIEAENLEKFDR